MTGQHTFRCDLRPGLSVQASINAEALKERQARYLDVIWSGTPTKADMPQYLEWMLTVQQACAEMVGGRIIYAMPDDKGGALYLFEPGKPWRRL